MTNNTLLILAGGISSRMKKSVPPDGLSEDELRRANTSSKSLICYGKRNRPFLDFLLNNADEAGYQHVYLIVGIDSKSFKKYYGKSRINNSYKNLNISYVIQNVPEGRDKPLGTADAVFQAMDQYPLLREVSFTVCNSDNLYSVASLKSIRTMTHGNAFIAYNRNGLQFEMERISRFALVRLDSENYLIDIIEKPSKENLMAYLDSEGKLRVSMNLFKFNGKSIYSYLKNCPIHPQRGEKELPTAVLNYCKEHPKGFKGIPFNEHVPDLTSKEDIIILKKYIEHYLN